MTVTLDVDQIVAAPTSPSLRERLDRARAVMALAKGVV